MAVHKDPNSELPLAVVAIDFGTTYSGYAYTHRSEYQKASKARNIFHNSWASGLAGNNSAKAPTVALFKPDKTFHSFGYEAEKTFSDLTEEKTHSKWYYFSKFKMQLFDKMTLSPDLATSDQSGKSLPAIEVFSESIKYLVKAAVKQIEEVSEKDITWVLTVPAIWNEPAKQFMRQAAIKAGIDKDKLMLALEPEAAAIYCRYLPTTLNGKDENDILSFLHKGGRYMVVDMGGGTVDIAVHEVSDDGNRLVELIPVSGGAWGGDIVNQSFINYFDKIGETKSETIKQTRTSHWMKFESNFEATKRNLKSNDERAIRIDVPPVIITEAQLDINLAKSFKMNIRNEDFRSFFDSTKHVIGHMKHILNRVADIELILMVGGYVQSDYVSTLIKREFRSKTVMVPTKAEVAVVEGAVLFGFEPRSVSARMCRHTYGIGCYRSFEEGFHREEYRTNIDGEDKCDHIFSKVATEGDILDITEKRVNEQFSSSHKDQSRRNITLNMPFYASTDKTCQYTTDISCKHIGNITLKPPADGWPEKIHYRVEMYFGRTEFEVKVFNDTDESEYNAKFDFLIEQKVPNVLPCSPSPAQETKSRCTIC